MLVAHGDQGGGYILYIENGHLESVTYVPGAPAPYSPEAVLRATIQAAHAFE